MRNNRKREPPALWDNHTFNEVVFPELANQNLKPVDWNQSENMGKHVHLHQGNTFNKIYVVEYDYGKTSDQRSGFSI